MATILIVDDRADNREFLTTLLGYANHHMLEAASASEALDLMRAERPDLVITDIVMPEVDGFEFVRQLRADPQIARTRVIFYSATYLESEMYEIARACGVMHVIVKPTEPEFILEIVHAALNVAAPATETLLTEAFDHQHQRLLLDKLAQKVDELEAANAGLEQRVQERTEQLTAANTRLQELNHLKDELLAIASHDIRSPLNAILISAELLLEEEESSSTEQRRGLVGNISAAGHHLLRLVSDLLDLAKIESGRVQLECIDLRLSDLLHQGIEQSSFTAKAKQITLRLDIAPGEQLVHADGLKLSQVFSNLLSNAIKFTPRGGSITVAIAPELGGMRVSVADTGIGIAAEHLPGLFEKFKQTRSVGTGGEMGTGLGLAIVWQIVALHNGSIEVASELHQGSIFTVHLPLVSLEVNK